MGQLIADRADLRFAELVCADPQWLRAEFDALIRAGFGPPPTWPHRPAPPRVPPRNPMPGHAGPPVLKARPATPGRPRSRGRRGRQRSPPP